MKDYKAGKDDADRITKILNSGGFFTGKHSVAMTSWNNVSMIHLRIREITAKLEGTAVKVACCQKPCYEKKDAGALYVRPDNGDPALANYKGMIIICPKGLANDAGSFGGCGCLVLHEVLHVIGLRGNEKEYEQKNYRRDNAMIKLANELLKASKKHCKGYDVK